MIDELKTKLTESLATHDALVSHYERQGDSVNADKHALAVDVLRDTLAFIAGKEKNIMPGNSTLN